MDRLKALAIFKAVWDHGSFSRAASAMALSPAVVTRTVQELEALLGVRLLQRTTRRIALTAVGEDVLARAQGLLESFEELATMSSLCATVPSGTVRISAPLLLGRRHLGPALASFMAHWPTVWVDLRLREGPLDEVDDDMDLALCLGRDLRPSLIAQRVAVVEVGVYASPGYLARRGVPAQPADLQAHDCLTCGGQRGDAEWRFTETASGRHCTLPARGGLHASHAEVLVGAAMHGAGIALLPDFLADDAAARGELRRLLPGWRADPLTLHLAYRSRRHQPLAVRKLIEHLAQSLQRIERDDAALEAGPAGRPAGAGALAAPREEPALAC